MLQGLPGRSASTTVDVAVQGINDNPPVFSELFYAAVYENSPIGTVVLQVTSTDADAGGSTSTRYSLSSSAGGLFAIDPVSGVITVAGSIDREVNSMYILKVAANDGAFNIETSITIDVLDENDNIPQCIATSYAFSVLESSSSSSSSSSSASSSFVGSVASTDADATSPNNVTFFRMRNWDRDFVVAGGSRNGSVSWRNGGVRFEWIGGTPAGRPSPTNVRHAVLSVIDRGDPPLSSSCPMTVTVLPENRFSPTFAKSWYQVVIPATAPAGFMIMTLSATLVLKNLNLN